jgi:hypothetical protein
MQIIDKIKTKYGKEEEDNILWVIRNMQKLEKNCMK